MKFIDIDSICKKCGIKNYTINSDGTVDVDGNVNFFNLQLTKLPLKFGKVNGNFTCSSNKLTLLEGCPQSVGGSFDCCFNELISLEGCPQSVTGYFSLYENKLKDLYGFPEFFYGHIYYEGNPVTEILDLFKKTDPTGLLEDIWFRFNLPNVKVAKIIDLLNEYGVIQQDGKLVILDRLEEVFHILNMEIPEINLKNYEVY